MQTLVLVKTDWEGNECDPLWHVINDWGDDHRTLCDGMVLSDGTEADYKKVKRGGITCPKCIEAVKSIKQLKL